MKTLKVLSFACIIAAVFTGCKGDTGPAGPAGANGVANISSNIYTISPSDWVSVSGGYTYTVSDGSIASANTDGVEVFISDDDATWAGIPANNVLANGSQMEYVYQNGQIAVVYIYSSAPTVTLYLKVVVIPPAVMKRHPNTNWNDYSQVQALINAQVIKAD